MAMIMPKGIVVLIEGSIAGNLAGSLEGGIKRLDKEPVDLAEIAQLWKVYTTTKRRLRDPTAERLENYWWRIWGSRKRQLDGATVARLFAQISDGQSFVPLRGLANCDEGTPPLENNTQSATGVSSAMALQLTDPSTTSPTTNPARTAVIMPPPILKKSRGPSTTGPRPTARFVSPHGSENEPEEDLPGGLDSNVVVTPPSPDGEVSATVKKKPSLSGRKKPGFVAASATKKKRPVMVRRQNSQSSADSTKTRDSSKYSGSSGSSQSPLGRSPPMLPEHVQPSQEKGKQAATSRFQEQFSPVYRVAAPTSSTREKAGSKRIQSKGDSSRKSSKKSETTKPPEIHTEVPALRGSDKQGSANNIQSPRRSPQTKSTKSRRESDEEKKVTLQKSNTIPQSEEISPRTNASSEKENLSFDMATEQNTEQNRKLSTEHSRSNLSRRTKSSGELSNDGMEIMQHQRKSSAILAPTLTPATGQLALGDAATDTPPASSPKRLTLPIKDNGKDRAGGAAPPRDALFSKKPVQTVGTPAAVSDSQGPLARSKSQLTLLLEKDQEDRAKNAEHKPRSNGKRQQ